MEHPKPNDYFLGQVLDKLLSKLIKGNTLYDSSYLTKNHVERTAAYDVYHVREIHVGTRLREAEDMADLGEIEKAMSKVESAIGYLVILHQRLSIKLKAEEDNNKEASNADIS